MNPEIISLACTLSKASVEVRLIKANYQTAVSSQKDISDRLTNALYQAEIWEPIAITLDDNEVLVCAWNGEDGYDISLVRSYN
jgi:hypothetical protein